MVWRKKSKIRYSAAKIRYPRLDFFAFKNTTFLSHLYKPPPPLQGTGHSPNIQLPKILQWRGQLFLVF